VDDVIKHNCYLLQEEDEEVIWQLMRWSAKSDVTRSV
jgi:hypothetical protein